MSFETRSEQSCQAGKTSSHTEREHADNNLKSFNLRKSPLLGVYFETETESLS